MKISTVEDLRNFIEGFLKSKGVKGRVLLFGSRARGDHTVHSDVDIAIDTDADIEDLLQELKEIIEESELPQKVDLLILSKAPPDLRREIEKEGKVWIDLRGQ